MTKFKELSRNRQTCGGKRVIVAKVRLIVCGVTTNKEARNYIADAVEHWGGQFEFPCSENRYRGNPLCTRYTHLLETTVCDGRLDSRDIRSYLKAVAFKDNLWEYPGDVE